MLYQLSYEASHWEGGQFIEFILFSRAVNGTLSNWKEEAWKNQGFNGIGTRDRREYWCDALPTELWSHTLGARSIYWVHIFPCSEVMWSISEIINICTVVVDESGDWRFGEAVTQERRDCMQAKTKGLFWSPLCFLVYVMVPGGPTCTCTTVVVLVNYA